MNVGVVATSYPRWPGDAAGSFVANHAAYLRSTGATVEVLAAGHGLPAPPALFYGGGAPEALERSRQSLDTSPRSSVDSSLGDVGAWLGVYAAAFGFSTHMLAAIARRAWRWDALAAHWLAPSAIAAALATPRRVRLLAIAHGGDVHLLERLRLLAPALALLDARDARIAFVSDELRRRALDALPRVLASRIAARSIVQAMGVGDDRAAAIIAARQASLDARAALARDRPTLVILARLVPVKSIDTALAALARTRTPARLIIAGDGPLRAALTAAAQPLGERVTFTGWLDADARDALLATADALLIPSAPLPGGRSEGAPLAAREALAAGVPVIASATGGLVELASFAGVTLVPPRDPHALAEAIDRTLEAPAPAPRPDLGWRHAGAALDRHWRAPSYAPDSSCAQARSSDWSSRPADHPDSPMDSAHLRVTPAC